MDSFTREIPVYRSTVHVGALQVRQVVPNPRGFEIHFRDARFVPMEVSAEWVQANCPLPGGYIVFGNVPAFMHQQFFETCFAPTDTGLRMGFAGDRGDGCGCTKH